MRETGNFTAISAPKNLELSCLHLGFYLASWGMYRGSSQLLQRSIRQLVPVIEALAGADPMVWQIDANQYTDKNIQALLDFSKILRKVIQGMSEILATKIMLGVFGNTPAFDTNFKKGFVATTYGPKALRRVKDFYQQHGTVIDAWRVPTLDFDTGNPTRRLYPRAKVIDMIFFVEGIKKHSA